MGWPSSFWPAILGAAEGDDSDSTRILVRQWAVSLAPVRAVNQSR